MNLKTRLFNVSTSVSEEDAQRLQAGAADRYTVEVRPPRDDHLPATVASFVQGIRELQTTWLGLVNASPITAYEIRRTQPGQLRFQYSVPTKRLERKLRTHLQNTVPGVEFASGTTGLPVSEGESIGGGVLTLGREDWYPLRREFDEPPSNAVVGALHRHAMQDTKVVVQVLFQPVIGHPVKRWWWTRNAYKRLGYLRKEKPRIFPWHDRPATPRERSQADAIERKAGTPRFSAAIRFLVIGAGERTPSRVKELSGAFNVYESPDTGQYFDTVTVSSIREAPIFEFAESVARHQFDGSIQFQISTQELAALVSLPDRQQDNIRYAQP